MQVNIVSKFFTFVMVSSFLGFLSVDGIISVPNKDLPCASGITTLPPFNNFEFLPKDKFSPKIPSGVNVCDASCGAPSVCTYNWAESLMGFPNLLFKCKCPKLCPPLRMRYSGYLKINCKDVTFLSKKTRCKCPYGRTALQCSLQILPLFSRNNPYYCMCCDAHIHTFTHIIHETKNNTE